MDQRRNLKKNVFFFELNETENTTYQNLWDVAKQYSEENLQFRMHILKSNKEVKSIT